MRGSSVGEPFLPHRNAPTYWHVNGWQTGLTDDISEFDCMLVGCFVTAPSDTGSVCLLLGDWHDHPSLQWRAKQPARVSSRIASASKVLPTSLERLLHQACDCVNVDCLQVRERARLRPCPKDLRAPDRDRKDTLSRLVRLPVDRNLDRGERLLEVRGPGLECASALTRLNVHGPATDADRRSFLRRAALRNGLFRRDLLRRSLLLWRHSGLLSVSRVSRATPPELHAQGQGARSREEPPGTGADGAHSRLGVAHRA